MKMSELVSNTILFAAAVLSVDMAQANHGSESVSTNNSTLKLQKTIIGSTDSRIMANQVAAKSLEQSQLAVANSVNLNHATAAVLSMSAGVNAFVAAKTETPQLDLNMSDIVPKNALPLGVWGFLSIVLCILRFKKRKMFA